MIGVLLIKLSISISHPKVVRQIIYVDSADKLPQNGEEFSRLNYYCIKPDKLQPKYTTTNSTDLLYPKDLQTRIQTVGKTVIFNLNGNSSVDSINFNTSIDRIKEKPEKGKVVTYHKTSTNCTSDGLENYTVKINHICDNSNKFTLMPAYKSTECEYVIRMSSRKLCRNTLYSDHQLQKIYCIEKSKLPDNYFD